MCKEYQFPSFVGTNIINPVPLDVDDMILIYKTEETSMINIKPTLQESGHKLSNAIY